MNRILAALCGLIAVAIGAFGAHAITDPQAKAWIATGASYGMVHGVAALWADAKYRLTSWLWVTGALLFSGSLYALGLGAPRAAAMVAPIGGGLMIAGWALLLPALMRRR